MQDTQRIPISSIFNAIKDSYPVDIDELINVWTNHRSPDSWFLWMDTHIFVSLMKDIGKPVEMVNDEIDLKSIDAVYLCEILVHYYNNNGTANFTTFPSFQINGSYLKSLLFCLDYNITDAFLYKSNVTNACDILQKRLPHLASIITAYQKYWMDQFKNRKIIINNNFRSYFKERGISIKINLSRPSIIDFDQISTLHLCEYLRDFTVGHNISHPLLDQLIEMCQQNEQSVELMKVLISKSNDYGGGLFFEEVVIYKNVFEQMLPQLTKYKKFKSLDSDGHPITEDVYLRKEDTIELPWFFSKMYVKKDSGFVLTDEMLFHYSYMMDVKIIEIVIGYHDSQTIKKEFVISLDDYKELPSELINEQDHVYSGFWDDID